MTDARQNVSEVRVPWSGRGLKYTEEEIDVVVAAMRDADPMTQGAHQQAFEDRFAAYTKTPHAFALSSCTAALELAAILCRFERGDEVIMPAHTFAASAIPFARGGAKLVWADIDPETWLATAETIKPLIGPRTKAIVLVHLYGQVSDLDPIMELAAKHNLLVIEDVAQAIGADYKGRPAGSIGDFGCFSFHTHKNISTLGEGGMLTVKSGSDARLVPGLRHNGMRAYEGERKDYWLPAMSNVDIDIDGIWPNNFCIGEIQCALGTKLLDRLDTINRERRERGLMVREALSKFPELVFQKQTEGGESTYHLLPARYDGATTGATRDDLMRILAYEEGVKVVVQYYPLYRYPLFQKFGLGEANCPNTDSMFDSMLSFPFQHWLTDEQVETMICSIRSALLRLR
jgi:perosamine synthetase